MLWVLSCIDVFSFISTADALIMDVIQLERTGAFLKETVSFTWWLGSTNRCRIFIMIKEGT